MVVFQDPIYREICFDSVTWSWLRPFVEHSSVQRLKHISQLGLSYLEFPETRFSRFSHSLGACYLAYRLLERLRTILLSVMTDTEFDRYKQYSVIAALLHDVGHGPFSHAFEQLFAVDDNNYVIHEDWTECFLLKVYGSVDFLDYYNQQNPNHPLFRDDLLIIAALIRGRQIQKIPLFLNQLIASDLDVDRLDYVARDSYYCGFGHFDSIELLDALTFSAGEKTSLLTTPLLLNDNDEIKLFKFIQYRRRLTEQIYLSPLKSVAEYLLQIWLRTCALHFATCDCQEDNKFLVFLEQSGHFMLRKLKKRQFLASSFFNYAGLVDNDVFYYLERCALSKDNYWAKSLTDLARVIYLKRWPLIYRICPENYSVLLTEVKRLRRLYGFGDAYLSVVQPYKKIKAFGMNKQEGRGKLTRYFDQEIKEFRSWSYLFIDKTLARDPRVSHLILKADLVEPEGEIV